MSSAASRILILSSNTGGGHQSAAGALEESLLRLSPGQALVTIAQVLEDATLVTHQLAKLYNYLLRYHQHYMRYYYWAIQKIRPYESHMLFQYCMKYGMQLLEHWAPNTLVSVHPMTQHFFAYILKKLRLIDKIPLITVVTDPCEGFWKGWACPEVSQYFVASEDAKNQLIEYGIADNRIRVTGMPVHSKFKPLTSSEEKHQLRQQLQWDPERFTVLVNAGWVGGGNIPMLYETLIQSAPDNLQLVFLSGKNKQLYQEAQMFAQNANIPVHVLGYSTQVEQLMNASDVMISKLGGLTTFEAMACHLPILGDCLTPPMPQEEGTARFIERHGAGRLIHHPHELGLALSRMIQDPDYYQTFKTATARVGQPGAVDRIAHEILNQPSH